MIPVPQTPSEAAPVAMEGGSLAEWLFAGWDGGDVTLLALLPVLVMLSGTISASETILFGLTEGERLELREHQTIGSRAIDALLADPAMLLISILLANTTINVLYFVITSVLVIHLTAPAAVQAMAAVFFLLLLVLGGEVGPKIIGDAARRRLALVLAPPLFAYHRAIAPLRLGLRRFVIGPLGRLTAPASRPPELAGRELQTLVDVTQREGLLDPAERELLRDLLDIRRRKVRDVMTPRVAMPAVPIDAARRDVRGRLEHHRVGWIPVFEGSLDRIVGVLDARRYLLAASDKPITHPMIMQKPVFVPEVASLEQLLDLFRKRRCRLAIVVDEYGGTSGMVLVEDVVKEVVGNYRSPEEERIEAPQLVGLGRFRVSGDMSLHDFMQFFAPDLDEARTATLSGLIVDALGRPPQKGDHILLGDLNVEVETVSKHRVATAFIQMPAEVRDGHRAEDGDEDAKPSVGLGEREDDEPKRGTT